MTLIYCCVQPANTKMHFFSVLQMRKPLPSFKLWKRITQPLCSHFLNLTSKSKMFSRQYLIISNDLNLLLCATSKHENALLFSFANEKMVVGRFFLPWVVLSPRLMESRDFSGAHTTTITFFSKSFLSRFHD